MNLPSKVLAVAVLAATAPWFAGSAGAAPLGAPLALQNAAGSAVQTVQWRGRWGGRGWWGGPAAGFAAGAIIGGAVAASQPWYGYDYYGYSPSYYGYSPSYYNYGYAPSYYSYGYDPGYYSSGYDPGYYSSAYDPGYYGSYDYGYVAPGGYVAAAPGRDAAYGDRGRNGRPFEWRRAARRQLFAFLNAKGPKGEGPTASGAWLPGALEVFDRALVLFGSGTAAEGAEVAALPGSGVLLA
jgi:hypothetical protein